MKRRPRAGPAASRVAGASHRVRLLLCLLAASSGFANGSATPMPRPIVDAETGQLYGAVAQTRWIGPEQLPGGTVESLVFASYRADGTRGSPTRLRRVPTAETCSNPTYRPVPAPRATAPGSYLVADWNAAPRRARSHKPENARYRALVSAWLASRGIADRAPRIAQLLRVDLDGDGRDEVMLAAQRQRGSVTSTRAGDYSVLLLRRWQDGGIVTLPVVADLYPRGCVAECAPARYRIFSMLDLNGDGRLEMIITRRDYEGVSRSIHDFDQPEQPRLQWHCSP